SYLAKKIPERKTKIEEKKRKEEERKRLADERRMADEKSQQELKKLKLKIGALSKEGLLQYEQGKYGEAKKTFSQILGIDPDHSIAKRYVEVKIPRELKRVEEETLRQTKKEESDVSDESAITEEDDGEYRIKPFDALSVKVYREEELSGVYKVQKGGFIDMPLVRKVPVQGLTVYEIEDKVTAILAKDFLTDPQIMITVKEYHSEKVVVLGQINKPGTYELSTEEPVTLLRAISMSGGFTNIAAKNNIKVIRMQKGKKTIMKINSNEIIDGKKKDFVLKPGDMIIVPESFW
ncbi:MAG: polysaccharide export protein, partial [Candidatus Omnitrophica bacterium]|nr:polysaccharide export protein [Candidatus Omnitrophota bacterium]